MQGPRRSDNLDHNSGPGKNQTAFRHISRNYSQSLQQDHHESASRLFSKNLQPDYTCQEDQGAAPSRWIVQTRILLPELPVHSCLEGSTKNQKINGGALLPDAHRSRQGRAPKRQLMHLESIRSKCALVKNTLCLLPPLQHTLPGQRRPPQIS